MSQPIYMTIPITINSLEFTLYIKPGIVNTMKSYYQVGFPLSVLYIQKKIPQYQKTQITKEMRNTLSFPITLSNIYDAKMKFKAVLSWYTDENKKLLYGVNNTGQVMFNSEYASLNALFVTEFGSIRTAMKIIPSVIEVAANIYEPGAILYINKQENSIRLREKEIIRLASFIINFDHTIYTNFAMSCMDFAHKTGNLFSYEEVQRRMEINKMYDNNLR